VRFGSGPDRLLSAVQAALPGHRSTAALFDAFVTAIRAQLGASVRVSLSTEAAGRAWLQAQAGHHAAVHSVSLGHGIVGRAIRTGDTQLVDEHASDGDLRPLLDGVAAVIVHPFELAGSRGLLSLESVGEPFADWVATALDDATTLLDQAVRALSPRARADSTTTSLSRTFVRIAAQDDPLRLLELACRTVGEMLDLDAVQAFRLDAETLVEAASWRRSHGALRGGDADSARRVAEMLSWEPGRVRVDIAASDAAVAGLATRGVATVDVLPLRAAGLLLGVLVGFCARDAHLPLDRLEQAELVAAHTAATFANLERYQSVVAASLTDALTGLANHRRFHEDGAALLDACRATATGFGLVICDLDDFKDLNDRKGHVAGDDALRLVGRILAHGVRPDDRAFRLGGEEFALLLPQTAKTNARTVCRRLQRALAGVDIDGWRLTVSMGVATFPADGESLRDLLAAADAALFEAKRLGKDRITFADERLVARRTSGDLMAARGRRSFEQMRHLQALAAALSRARSAPEIARVILAELAEAMPHEAAVVILHHDDQLRVVAERGVRRADVRDALSAFAAQSIATSRGLLVDDASVQHPPLAAAALRGLAAAPLVAEEHVVGAVVVGSSHSSRYDRDDQRLLEVVGHIGGLATENQVLLEARDTAAAHAEALLALPALLAQTASRDELADAVRLATSTILPDHTNTFVWAAQPTPVSNPAADRSTEDAVTCPIVIDQVTVATLTINDAAALTDTQRRLVCQLAAQTALAVASHPASRTVTAR
jgi:diguanylate cyclase (GGDEF)-like protein